MKQKLIIACIAALGLFSMSPNSLSHMDMKTGMEGTGFNFKYTGTVNTSGEVMPLVGQLSKDGLKMYFTSQNFKGEKQLYIMKRDKLGAAFKKPERLKGTINSADYDII